MSFVENHMRDSLKDHVLEQVLDTEKFRAFYLKKPGGGRMMSTLIMFTPEGIVITGDLCPGQRGVISTLGYGLDWFAGKLSEDYLCQKFFQQGWHRELAERELEELARQIRAGEYDDFYAGQDLKDAAECYEGALDDVKMYVQDFRTIREMSKDDPQRAEELENVRASLKQAIKEAKPLKKALQNAREKTAKKLDELKYFLDGQGWESFSDSWAEAFEDYDWECVPGLGYNPADAGWLCAIQQKFSELYWKTQEVKT